jgi:hypothetical protein
VTSRVTTNPGSSKRRKGKRATSDPVSGLAAILAVAGNVVGVNQQVDEWPEWVRDCADRWMKARHSRIVEVENDQSIAPARKGGIALGLIKGGLDQLRTVRTNPGVTALLESDSGILIRTVTDSNISSVEGLLADPDISSEMKLEVSELMKIFTFEQKAEFYQGLAEGYNIYFGQGRSNDATDIHLFMVSHWQQIERLRSVTELRALLVKQFGERRVGSGNKRVSQICGRVGLKFRGRGRPKKNASDGGPG